MKKYIQILLSFILIFSLVSCGKAQSETDSKSLSPSDGANMSQEESLPQRDTKIKAIINDEEFIIDLNDSRAAEEFCALLPMTADMSELNGNEKYYYLSDSLTTSARDGVYIQTGDFMLYGNKCIVIFYKSFATTYSYTPLGRAEDPDGLAAALGKGDVTVTFEKAE